MAEHTIDTRHPTSAKFYLSYSSRLAIEPISRWKPEGIGAHEGQPLLDLAAYVGTGLLTEAALAAFLAVGAPAFVIVKVSGSLEDVQHSVRATQKALAEAAAPAPH